MENKIKLLFISTRFLFPANTGGQIRTTQILRGLKGGKFSVKLVSPAPPNAIDKYAKDIGSVCDEFDSWLEPNRGPLFNLLRLRYLFGSTPISIATDGIKEGILVVKREIDKQPDLIVFDFPHSMILAPESISIPMVMFTHNVEAEIFERHMKVASNIISRLVWRDQFNKMYTFEKRELARFAKVIAVSKRDSQYFEGQYGIRKVADIRTGVDLDFFEYNDGDQENKIIFIGSMDWMANIDGINYFMDEIWSKIIEIIPAATMTVIGRNPPQKMIEKAQKKFSNWNFTGFVDDIRDHTRGAAVCVIPLRIGGGTRIKAFEAMAMGCPVVSTSIGVEGLQIDPDTHYLCADDAAEFATSVIKLLKDKEKRITMAKSARSHVDKNFSFTRAAEEFEDICLKTYQESSNS